MSTKTEYLQKYIGEKIKKKKVRKKRRRVLHPRIHIIDDDINTTVNAQDQVLESEEEFGEDAPQIAGVIEESKDKSMNYAKWKTIDNTTGCNLKRRLDSDSDFSPPRHQLDIDDISRTENKQLVERNPERNLQKRLDSDSDLSPPRHRLDTDDISRDQHKQSLAKISESSQQKRLDSDSDLSPPRQQLTANQIVKNKYKHSQERKSDSDLSPARSSSKHNNPKRKALITDVVLPAKKKILQKKHRDSDSDISPSGRQLHTDKISNNQKKSSQESSSDNGWSPPCSSSKFNGSERRNLASSSKKNEDKLDSKSKKSEKKLEKSKRVLDKKEIAVIQQTEEKHENNIDKAFPSNKNVCKSEASIISSLSENNEIWVPELFKPLARYKDDPELDEFLKKQERSGDTMLPYIHKKQKKEPNSQRVPVYQGPPPPPNRFNNMPGYRWDGVDRSNGYEKRYFELQAKKKSEAELAYKWSVENM